MSKIILTGGGTCGHIMPNLALLPHLKKYFQNIYYMGQKESLEERLCKKNNIPFYYTDTIKLERKKIYKNIMIPFVLSKGIKQAKDILEMLKPDVVFSKGGFASLPCALACRDMKIPIVLHESDVSLGVANKLLVKSAKKIIVSSAKTELPNDKFVCIGNPIREEITKAAPLKIPTSFKFSDKKNTILFVGGSLGAVVLNNLIIDNIENLTSKYNILHITGKNCNNAPNHNGYLSETFVDNIGEYYAKADVIVSRAGANAITEISALAKKVIYIPLPKGNSRGDQVDNAIASGAEIISQENLNYDLLVKTIDKLIVQEPPKKSYNDGVPKAIVDTIIGIL